MLAGAESHGQKYTDTCKADLERISDWWVDFIKSKNMFYYQKYVWKYREKKNLNIKNKIFLAAKAAPISRNVRSSVSQLVNKLKKLSKA